MVLAPSLPERAAPHDREAEKYVLGSVLLDRGAIFKVADSLRVEDFYVARHQRIYATALALLERRERIDPLTVQLELERREELDRAGGAAYLREITEAVPVSLDIERHARVVADRSLLRRLLGAAKDIAADAYDEPTDIALALDRAEQRLFALRDEAKNAQLRHIKHALDANYEQISERSDHRGELSGIPSGFKEIDLYTEGFTRGDLVVLAARPSVGKTSLALALAYHAARQGTGVLVFSLEMDVKQIVTRFLGLTGQANILTLRTGSDVLDTGAADALLKLPILIDDTPGISIMELRTKARRAMSHTSIGVIIVDYLQLMRTGEKEENRVQEISTITRNLKSLARELNVVVVALSQLSRAAGDFGHEPKLSTLRECVTGDTVVLLADGRRVPIGELVGTMPAVASITPGGKLTTAPSDAVWSAGVRPVIAVRFASGRSIRATPEHRLLGFGGWRTIASLARGDRVALARRLPEPASPPPCPADRLALLGQLIGDGSYLSNQPMRYTNEDEDNLAMVTEAAQREFGAKITRYSYPQHGPWSQLLISGNGNRWHPAGVNAWLRDLGIFGQRSHQKRVPRAMFSLSNASIGTLLRHMWATDGTISVRKVGRGGDNVYYATNSHGLALDVAALLLRFGIVARIFRVAQDPYGPLFHVEVSGAVDQRQFLKDVGAFGPRVGPANELAAVLERRVANTNVDTFPIEALDLVRTAVSTSGITYQELSSLRGLRHGGRTQFQKFSPSRRLLNEYAQVLDSAELREIASSDLFWDRVVSITVAGDEEVFDMTVPSTSSWLADGIVSHNSGAIEQDSDQVIMLWRDKEETIPGAPKLIKGSVAKNRNGPTGIFELYFEAEQARFFSRAREDDLPV
ncbi:MAG: replicative DNA helicase [Chloroflexi bacterium]|nr:replicative DNA helicase [Chloroflexota bacterium]